MITLKLHIVPRDRKHFENELEVEEFINCSENKEEWSKEFQTGIID